MLNLPWDEPPVEVRVAAVKWVNENNVDVESSKSKTTIVSPSMCFYHLDPNYKRGVLHESRTHAVGVASSESLTDTAPSHCPVVSKRRSYIYHRLDCPNYSQVAPHNRVAFNSTAEAEAAGSLQDLVP